MPSTLMEKAYLSLRMQVESGELPPGSQLVNRTLCKQLGVSTIPLREAIQRLTSEGLLEHIPNAGAFVRKLDRRELIQLVELRQVLDQFGLERAAVHIDEDQLEQLSNICTKWRQTLRSVRARGQQAVIGEENREWINLDIRFHQILTEAAGNMWLTKVTDDLRLMSHITNFKPAEMKLGRAARNCRVHGGIVRGLRQHDLEIASYWMKRHGTYGLEAIKRNFADE